MTAEKQFFEPFGVNLDLIEGILQDPDSHLVRNASSMRGHYADNEALEELIRNGDPLHYEVFSKDIPEEYGHLHFGISKLQPGTVGDECFMTKGHYHADATQPEIYFCIRGEGYLLLQTRDGEFRTEHWTPGTMSHIPPMWAHRE